MQTESQQSIGELEGRSCKTRELNGEGSLLTWSRWQPPWDLTHPTAPRRNRLIREVTKRRKENLRISLRTISGIYCRSRLMNEVGLQHTRLDPRRLAERVPHSPTLRSSRLVISALVAGKRFVHLKPHQRSVPSFLMRGSLGVVSVMDENTPSPPHHLARSFLALIKVDEAYSCIDCVTIQEPDMRTEWRQRVSR